MESSVICPIERSFALIATRAVKPKVASLERWRTFRSRFVAGAPRQFMIFVNRY
jgi:hypothetical protein